MSFDPGKPRRNAYILLPKLVIAVFIRFSVLSFENSIYGWDTVSRVEIQFIKAGGLTVSATRSNSLIATSHAFS